jgi:hypothetical protein
MRFLLLPFITAVLLATLRESCAASDLEPGGASRVKKDRRYCARIQDADEIRQIADKVCARTECYAIWTVA